MCTHRLIQHSLCFYQHCITAPALSKKNNNNQKKRQSESRNTTLTLMRRNRRRKIWEQGKRSRKSCFFLNSFYRPRRKRLKSGTETESKSRWEILHAQAPFPCRSIGSPARCVCTPGIGFHASCQCKEHVSTWSSFLWNVNQALCSGPGCSGKLRSRGTGHVPGSGFGPSPSGVDPG